MKLSFVPGIGLCGSFLTRKSFEYSFVTVGISCEPLERRKQQRSVLERSLINIDQKKEERRNLLLFALRCLECSCELKEDVLNGDE